MNATDRKSASAALQTLNGLISELESVGATLRELAEAEQEKFENLTEGLQQGEKGQAIEQAADALSAAADACDSGELQTAIEELGNLEM